MSLGDILKSIHLGIRTLADTFISAIFRPLADSRLYSSITSPDRAHLWRTWS
jgi:hypothetical protein